MNSVSYRKHTGEERKFACSLCRKMFTRPGLLKAHCKLHTVELFTCTYCGMKFDYLHSLKSHVICSHYNEKSKINWSRISKLSEIGNHDIDTNLQCRNRSSELHDLDYRSSSVPTVSSGEVKSENSSVQALIACSQCSLTFSTAGSLEAHLRTHTGEVPFVCNHCNLRFIDSESLKIHLQMHVSLGNHLLTDNSEKPFACTQCSRRFTQPRYLKIHMATHNAEMPFACYLCGRRFTRSSPTNKHPLFHMDEKAFACTYCSKKYTYECNQKTHLRTHNSVKPFGCTLCDKRFTKLWLMIRHIQTHNIEKPFACKVCSVRFTQANDLKDHFVIHKLTIKKHDWTQKCKKPFACTFCGTSFKWLSGIKHHLLTHTGVKLYACTLCSKRFTDSSDLVKHIHLHSGKKPYPCERSSMIFTQSYSLKLHVSRFHSVENNDKTGSLSLPNDAATVASNNCKERSSSSVGKPYLSTHCGMTSSHLKTHVSSHTGERPFPCSVCSMKFKRLLHLKVHLRTHTGKRPFACSLCSMKFKRLLYLKVHLHTHTGKRPFACSLCSMKFKRLLHLKVHLRTHTGERPFACKLCGMKFIWPMSLSLHQTTHSVEPLTCSHCGIQFENSNMLKSYILCSQCVENGKEVSSRSPKIDHHDLDSNHQCERESSELLVLDIGFSSIANAVTVPSSYCDEKSENPCVQSQFACSCCSLTFSTAGSLEVHLRTHTGEVPFACMHCSLRFGGSDNLKTHLQTHISEKPFACLQCGVRFQDSTFLSVHLRTNHGESPAVVNVTNVIPDVSEEVLNNVTLENLLACTHCGRSFTDFDNFRAHLQTHNGEKPFACLQCGVRFSDSTFLSVHLRTNHGESSNGNVVNIDSSSFANVVTMTSDNCKEKLERASVQTSFACTHCSLTFSTASSCEAHIRSHTGEVPFACTHCNIRFSDSDNLKTHLRTHISEKPFACLECGVRFQDSTFLSVHLRTYHGPSPAFVSVVDGIPDVIVFTRSNENCDETGDNLSTVDCLDVTTNVQFENEVFDLHQFNTGSPAVDNNVVIVAPVEDCKEDLLDDDMDSGQTLLQADQLAIDSTIHSSNRTSHFIWTSVQCSPSALSKQSLKYCSDQDHSVISFVGNVEIKVEPDDFADINGSKSTDSASPAKVSQRIVEWDCEEDDLINVIKPEFEEMSEQGREDS